MKEILSCVEPIFNCAKILWKYKERIIGFITLVIVKLNDFLGWPLLLSLSLNIFLTIFSFSFIKEKFLRKKDAALMELAYAPHINSLFEATMGKNQLNYEQQVTVVQWVAKINPLLTRKEHITFNARPCGHMDDRLNHLTWRIDTIHKIIKARSEKLK